MKKTGTGRSEEEVDAILEIYAGKLAGRTSAQLLTKIPHEVRVDRTKFKSFVRGFYFILLHVVSDLVVEIDTKYKATAYEVPLGEDLLRVLKRGFFGEGRFYRVLHTWLDDKAPSWENLTPDARASLRAFYNDMAFVTWCALVYWSGGYVSAEVAKTL